MRLDRWVLRPEYPADEEFHRSVTELLGDWAAARRPLYEAVQIIDDRWSPRAVELRDRLNRNSVPVGFYDRGTEEGRDLMAADGFSVATAELPVVVLRFRPDVLPLQNPSDKMLADAFGVNAIVETDR